MEIKNIIENIKNLNNNQHLDIFHIIKKQNINYSQNNNGTFIDMNNLEEITINEIRKYLNVLEINNKENQVKDNLLDHNNNNFIKIKKDFKIEQIENKESNEIINQIEKDKIKCIKKHDQNKFLIAKKKYSKQFSTEKKDICEKLELDL